MSSTSNNVPPGPSAPSSSLSRGGKSSSFSASIKSVLSGRKEERNKNVMDIQSSSPSASSKSVGQPSLSRSYTAETITTVPDAINRHMPLQRAGTTGTTATTTSGSSSQNLTNASGSVRVVGRGGRGSRPRQPKPAPIEAGAAWETSSSTDARHDDHSSNASVTQPTTPKERVRVVGRGGYGSKHRPPFLPSQPVPTVPPFNTTITNQSSQSSSSQSKAHLDSKPRVRLGGRGGAGSRPRTASFSGNNSNEAGMKSIAALKVRWKGRRRSKTTTSSSSGTGEGSSHTSSNSHLPAISTNFASSNIPSSSSLSPIPSGPPTPTQPSTSSHHPSSLSYTSPPDLDSYSISSSSTPSSVPTPATQKYAHDIFPIPSKAERALGILVPTLPSIQADQLAQHHPIKSHQDSFSDEESIRYYRRASLPLSTISSFIRTDSVVLDDAEGEWADNKYDSEKSDSTNDGSLTPVSSIIFADRPPSPQPPSKKRRASTSLVDAGTGLVLLYSPPTDDDYSLSEYTYSLNDDAATDDYDDSQSLFTPQPPLDLTPITPHTSPSPGEPVSPMIFSARESMFISTGSKDDLHLLQVRDPSALDLNGPGDLGPQPLQVSVVPVRSTSKSVPTALPLKTGLSRAETINPQQFIRPNSPFMDYDSNNSFPRRHYEKKRPSAGASRNDYGWSGEWNRSDMQDVIHSLRMLK